MNRQEALTMAVLMHAYWPRWQLSADEADAEATLAAWADLAEDVDGQAMLAALKALCAEGRQFPPSVGEVRLRAIDLVADALGEGVPDLDQAWGEVREAVQQIGWYRWPTIAWSHPAIAAAVRAIGRDALCHDENQTALRAQFRDVYRSVAGRARGEQVTPPAALAAVADLADEVRERQGELGAG